MVLKSRCIWYRNWHCEYQHATASDPAGIQSILHTRVHWPGRILSCIHIYTDYTKGHCASFSHILDCNQCWPSCTSVLAILDKLDI